MTIRIRWRGSWALAIWALGCEPRPAPEPPTQPRVVYDIPGASSPKQAGESDAPAESERREDGSSPALPAPALATKKAPPKFSVRLQTTRGDFVVRVARSWAPRGADRFYNLVALGYFTDMALFRVLPGFVVQFGIHGQPEVSALWKRAYVEDDAVRESNKMGYLTFAKAGPNTRSTQIFINLKDNPSLDQMGFSPFGRVEEGMVVVESFYSGYGEQPSSGGGQQRLYEQGNAYLRETFPRLDYIKSAMLMD
jgi:peptidyl-prolyl cis-trans isomerase A (cyclophilin A)